MAFNQITNFQRFSACKVLFTVNHLTVGESPTIQIFLITLKISMSCHWPLYIPLCFCMGNVSVFPEIPFCQNAYDVGLRISRTIWKL